MESIDKRKSRSISLSDREMFFTEKIRRFYQLRSISDAIRYLIIRENVMIDKSTEEGVNDECSDK